MVFDTRLVSRTVSIGTAANFAEVVLADFPVKALTVTMALNMASIFNTPLIQGTVLVAAAGHSAVSQVTNMSWSALLVVRAAHWFPHTSNIGVRAANKCSRA